MDGYVPRFGPPGEPSFGPGEPLRGSGLGRLALAHALSSYAAAVVGLAIQGFPPPGDVVDVRHFVLAPAYAVPGLPLSCCFSITGMADAGPSAVRAGLWPLWVAYALTFAAAEE